MSVFRKRREEKIRASHRIVKTHGGKIRNFKTSEPSRLYGDMPTVPISANELVRRHQRTLRAQSRAEVCTDGYAKRFIQLVNQNVVGPTGFEFQARTLFVTNGNAEPDEAANQALERAWRDWSKPMNCDIHKRQSFAGLQHTAASTVATDGEIFIRMYRGRQYGPYGFQLQMIDPELVDVLFNDDLRSGSIIRMGIEYGDNWVPTAYYFRTPQANAYGSPYYYYSSANGQTYTRVPADEIIHLFIPSQVGMWRGLPWMSASLGRLHMTAGGEEAALTNFRTGASTMGFYKNTGDTGPLADNDDLEKTEFDLTDEVEPGQFKTLPPGIDFEGFDPKYPNGDFDPFMNRILKGAAAGLGISYHSFAQDLADVNYSTGRIGRLDDQDMWLMLQDWFRDGFPTRAYNAWLDQQLLMNTITINGTPINPARADKYRSVEFHGRRWKSVDPQKEWGAVEKKVNLRSTSLSRVMIENGISDPRAEWDQLAADLEYLESKGLTPQQAVAGPQLPEGESNES